MPDVKSIGTYVDIVTSQPNKHEYDFSDLIELARNAGLGRQMDKLIVKALKRSL